MRIKFQYILFLFLFGCSVEVNDSNSGKTDRLINDFLNTKNLPGLSVSVMKEGEIVYSKGFGYADVDSKTLINPSKTKFRIGSFSKTLTASALMILVEKEQIDLDKSIYSYTPEFPQKKWDFNLRMMTGHLSGIRHYKNDEMNITKNYDNIFDALEVFQDDPLMHEPGTKYLYSTHAWTLISLAIERAANIPFTQFMDSDVFSKLGMANTFAEVKGLDIDNKVTYYRKNSTGGYDVAKDVNNSWKWAGGGYISTTEDVLKFLNQHLNDDYLSENSLKALMTSQTTDDGKKTGYGIGWRIRSGRNGDMLYGHTGGSIGGTTYAFMNKNKKTIVVITSNIGSANFGQLPLDIFDIYN
jgi:serine beta-lactamase-like protein LACTB